LQSAQSGESASDPSVMHQALVDKLKGDGHIRTGAVEAAFRAVPRHLFVPEIPLDETYRDQAIPTKRLDGITVSSSSQPTVMAIMLEQLNLRPGHRVLEIGAGTGYNAALMAHLVGAAGEVVTLDIDEDIVEAARSHLAAAGFPQVRIVCGDGAFGLLEAAPFDRVVVTVGAADISPAWHEQLKPGGQLLLPLRLGGILTQKSVLFEQAERHLVSTSIRDCTFLMLRGAHAKSQDTLQLGSEPDLQLWADELGSVDPDTVYGLLTGPSRNLAIDIRLTQPETWSGLIFWLGLHETSLCGLAASGAMAEQGDLPWLVSSRSVVETRATVGLLEDHGLALLTRSSDASAEPFALAVCSFGDAEHLVQRLIDRVAAWDVAGRPASQGLQIRAYPSTTAHVELSNGIIVEKPRTRLVLNWLQSGPLGQK
jgi:protein-L-isoaspartate(D-aspartate) O-methyltransferase